MVTKPPTLRQQQKARTRELILESARTLFDKMGYDATTVRAVAAGAGVGLGTIFKHFPDKSSLLLASMIEDLEGLEARVMAAMDWSAPIDEQLRLFITAVYEFWGERQALAKVVLQQAWFVPGPWGDEYRTQTDLLIERGADLLANAQAQGQIQPDADPRLLSKAIYSYYLFSVIRDIDTPGYDPAALGEEMRSFFRHPLRGVADPEEGDTR
jgi:AcrR family transcriptional regulator